MAGTTDLNAGRGYARRIAMMVAVALLALASWSTPLDSAAEQRVDSMLTRALVTFATARALDAVISVLQSGQVGAQVGVGMSIQPGELLDPVNDLVEKFSDVMLVVTVALGVHKVLLSIGAYWVVPLVLSIVAAVIILASMRGGAPRWLAQVFGLLVLVRFAIPVATVGADTLFARFLAAEYESSQQVLDAIEGRSAAMVEPQPGEPDDGLVAKFRRMLSEGDGLRERASAIAEAADRIAEHVSNLIVVFVLQTIAFPVVLLWLLWQLARRLTGPPE
ncbi:MAG: hypothetical protein WCZ28_06460 [Burkholderiaceae bacterium]